MILSQVFFLNNPLRAKCNFHQLDLRLPPSLFSAFSGTCISTYKKIVFMMRMQNLCSAVFASYQQLPNAIFLFQYLFDAPQTMQANVRQPFAIKMKPLCIKHGTHVSLRSRFGRPPANQPRPIPINYCLQPIWNSLTVLLACFGRHATPNFSRVKLTSIKT